MDRKSSRAGKRPSRNKIVKRSISNRYQIERGEDPHASTSAKKQKSAEDEISVNSDISYRISNFITVFNTLSQYVKCRECDSEVKFTDGSRRGLGFKILINCENCAQKEIS